MIVEVAYETSKGRKRVKPYQCAHCEYTEYDDAIKFELVEAVPSPPKGTIKIPRDGNVVYIMNDQRDTLVVKRWPPNGTRRERREEFRVLSS